ncbi:MAG: hypothetical protein ACI8RZ_003251 [Myxococcota bacterium]|jgi:hypothetical protein
MSLKHLHLAPVTNIHSVLEGAHLPTTGWLAMPGMPERLVLDTAEETVIVRRDDGSVLQTIETKGKTLIGIDGEGALAIFSEDLSWNYQVWDLSRGRWLANPDPDFPRFILEEDGVSAWMVDLDTGDRYRLEELPAEDVRASA